jgi:hypothetical protein
MVAAPPITLVTDFQSALPPGDCPDAAEGNQHPGPGDTAPGVGFEMVNVTVDAAAPLSCVEVQVVETGTTTMGLLRLAVVWDDVQGIA